MENLITTNTAPPSTGAAYLSLGATLVALVSLVALHVVSPEFAPSWRMVSEYATGKYGWLLSVFFAAWGIGSWALALALWPLLTTTLGRIGLVFLVLAGVGEMMAAFFDIKHSLHGLAALIGMPSLPVSAVLLSIALRRQDTMDPVPMWSAHLPWISILLMALGMAAFMTSLSRAGVAMSPGGPPLTELPADVIAVVGWANRLVVVSYALWVMLVARNVLLSNTAPARAATFPAAEVARR